MNLLTITLTSYLDSLLWVVSGLILMVLTANTLLPIALDWSKTLVSIPSFHRKVLYNYHGSTLFTIGCFFSFSVLCHDPLITGEYWAKILYALMGLFWLYRAVFATYIFSPNELPDRLCFRQLFRIFRMIYYGLGLACLSIGLLTGAFAV